MAPIPEPNVPVPVAPYVTVVGTIRTVALVITPEIEERSNFKYDSRLPLVGSLSVWKVLPVPKFDVADALFTYASATAVSLVVVGSVVDAVWKLRVAQSMAVLPATAMLSLPS